MTGGSTEEPIIRAPSGRGCGAGCHRRFLTVHGIGSRIVCHTPPAHPAAGVGARGDPGRRAQPPSGRFPPRASAGQFSMSPPSQFCVSPDRQAAVMEVICDPGAPKVSYYTLHQNAHRRHENRPGKSSRADGNGGPGEAHSRLAMTFGKSRWPSDPSIPKLPIDHVPQRHPVQIRP
jgi:hypothetical protein